MLTAQRALVFLATLAAWAAGARCTRCKHEHHEGVDECKFRGDMDLPKEDVSVDIPLPLETEESLKKEKTSNLRDCVKMCGQRAFKSSIPSWVTMCLTTSFWTMGFPDVGSVFEVLLRCGAGATLASTVNFATCAKFFCPS